MNRTQAVNPKLTLIRKVLAKARPVLLRGVGTQARVQVNPAAAEAEILKLEESLNELLRGALAATGLPVLRSNAEIPTEGAVWVYEPLTGRRNAKHGNLCSGPALGFVQDGRMAAFGLLLAEAEDATVASAGEGAHGPDGRLRVSARDLTDAVVMLPMSSIDTETLRLMHHAEAVPFHTRKSGNLLADALRSGIGLADGMIGTRFSAFERLATDLLVREAGGTCKVHTTQTGEVLLAGNVKTVSGLQGFLK